MKLNIKKHFFCIAFLMLCTTTYAQSLFVGSYNIRYKNNGDENNGFLWNKRCQVICDQINFEEPQIFGTQEVLVSQLNDMKKALPSYNAIGVGRDDGKEEGEYAAIFYNKNKIDKLEDGHFWLSQTPSKPSLGWDAACIRICTWGKFKQKKTGFEFFFFNLHTDHVGVIARREAAKLVIKKIKEIAGQHNPVILTGDFNVDQTDETYKIFTNSGILNDSYVVAKNRFAENGTFNDFDINAKTDSRIDHIFVSNGFCVNNYAILTNSYWTTNETSTTRKGKDAPQQIDINSVTRRNPSDHYPVFAKIKWCKNKTKKQTL